MKTIVLFFVLCAFAAAAANHSKKHKAQETEDAPEDSNHDWPQTQSIGEFGVPEDYSGTGFEPALPTAQAPGDHGDTPGRAHATSSRRHHN